MRTSHGRAVIIILYLQFLLLAYDLRETARISPTGHHVYLGIAIAETIMVILSIGYRTECNQVRLGLNKDFVAFAIAALQCSALPFAAVFFSTSWHTAFLIGLQILSVLAIGLAAMVEAFITAILAR